MGRVIAKKIRGMNLWVKVGLVTTLTLLVSVLMYQGWYKPNSAQAASVTRYFMQSNGTSVGVDGTTNWTSNGTTRPTIDLLDSPAPATSLRTIPQTVNGTNTLMYRAYSPAITSNTIIAANATTTVYLRDDTAVTDSSTVTVRLYDYDPNGVAGNGTLIGTATVATNTNIPGAATAYTGTLNNGSYALTASAANPKRLRMEVWINTNQAFGLRIYSGGATSSSITTDETVCNDPDPSTITIPSSQSANGNSYNVSGMKTTTGDVGTFEYKVTTVDPPAAKASYVFTDGTNGNTFTYDVTANDPPTNNTTTVATAPTAANYTSISTDDAAGFTLNGGFSSEAIQFALVINQTPANITSIDIKFSGRASAGDNLDRYIWNRTTSTWDSIDTIALTTTDQTFATANFTGNFSDYVNASNVMYIQFVSTISNADPIIDYVSFDVNYDNPPTTCTDWQSSASIPATTAGGSLCGDYTNGGTYTLDVRGIDPDCGIAVTTTPTNFIWNSTTAPTLTSPTATSIANTSATLGANVTANGGAAITARGTVWDTAASPTVNAAAEGGTTTGAFTQARTGLPAGTKIYYRGYATNSAGTGYSPDGSFYTEPATQASGITFTGVGPTGMTVNWTRGSGDGVIVLMKASSAVNSNPVDGTYTGYTASTAFGSGTQLGTGNYVVYKGTGTSVAVTGLSAGTTYHVAVYEYAGTVNTAGVDQGTNYLLTPATGSQIAVVPPPPTVTTPITPNSGQQGTTNLNVAITGTNFVSGCTASFSGGGITVNSTTWNSATSVTANIDIAVGATLGARNITVTNPDAQAGTGTGLFTVNAGTCTANAPTVTLSADASVTKGQQTSYAVTVTNNDNAFCGSTTFTIAIGTETGNTVSFVLPSVLGSTTTGALAPGATYNTTLTVKAQAAGTVGHTLTSQVNVSGAGHTTQSDSATTTIVSSWTQNALLHNSTNATNTSKSIPYWNANGGWGLPGTKYGAFDCTTCHIPGSTNISRIKVTLTAPTDTFPGSAVLFKSKTTENDAVNPSFGVYSAAITNSTKICEVCHTQTTYHKQNMTAIVGHENQAKEVDCIACHKHNQGFKAIGGCTICHKFVQRGDRTAVMSQFSSGNSHHIQGVNVTDQQCYQCHWEANSDGTVNVNYHGGSLKTGATVDLAVYQTGARPTTVSSATFVSYSAKGTRHDMEKLNTVCLGCHSAASAAVVPFGDGNTPQKYAWDGKSIDERYSQPGTTVWGKENAAWPNANPKRNQTKAYSAHGKATLNERGWDTAETWTLNTAPGTVNVLCYDCHNSHGSKVAGITSNYSSVTGRNRGAILKDTNNGVGGYTATYQPSSKSSTADKNAYNPGAGLCFDCHMNQTSSATLPWGYGTFGATQRIYGYRDSTFFGTPGGTDPAWGTIQKYSYKGLVSAVYGRAMTANMGGHFGVSSPLTTALNATPTINKKAEIKGLCTPCHDPHGVSPTLGANQAYAVPLLKGTWMTSPYKDDATPTATNEGRGGTSHSPQTNTTRPAIQPIGSTPRYTIDQNSFGASTTTTQPGGAPTPATSWNFNNTTDRITQTDTQFAGLCIDCHTKAAINNTAPVSTTNWKSALRVHNTVKGWALTTGTGGNVNNNAHSYTCSKCHTPHNYRLPRLLVTNCLNYKHRGQVASTGAIPTTAGSATGYQSGHQVTAGQCSSGKGRFPSGGARTGTSRTSNREPGPWFFGTIGTGWDTCHDSATAGGTTAASYPDNELWNSKSPW